MLFCASVSWLRPGHQGKERKSGIHLVGGEMGGLAWVVHPCQGIEVNTGDFTDVKGDEGVSVRKAQRH